MFIALRLGFYVGAITADLWLLPQIRESLNQAAEAASPADASRGYAIFAVYLVVGTILGLVVAWDVSRLVGEFAGSLFVGGGRLPSITPALWKADRLRAQNKPLEAVNTLREYLNARPRQWYVAVRIAELYQDDLNDPLSAALEYEALLRRRLPRAARAELMLRLASCNLLLRKTDQSASLLRELIQRFPGSPAALAAQRRLARITPESE